MYFICHLLPWFGWLCVYISYMSAPRLCTCVRFVRGESYANYAQPSARFTHKLARSIVCVVRASCINRRRRGVFAGFLRRFTIQQQKQHTRKKQQARAHLLSASKAALFRKQTEQKKCALHARHPRDITTALRCAPRTAGLCANTIVEVLIVFRWRRQRNGCSAFCGRAFVARIVKRTWRQRWLAIRVGACVCVCVLACAGDFRFSTHRCAYAFGRGQPPEFDVNCARVWKHRNHLLWLVERSVDLKRSQRCNFTLYTSLFQKCVRQSHEILRVTQRITKFQTQITRLLREH